MTKTAKKILKEEYNRLKKAFEKILKPGRGQALPQLVLQPVRNPPSLKH
ncbi:MAG: hypothetical protein ACT4OJ_01485 [Bacteroidota bacterium]